MKYDITSSKDQFAQHVQVLESTHDEEKRSFLKQINHLKNAVDETQIIMEQQERQLKDVSEENRDLTTMKNDILLRHLNEMEALTKDLNLARNSADSHKKALEEREAQFSIDEEQFRKQIDQMAAANNELNVKCRSLNDTLNERNAYLREKDDELTKLRIERKSLESKYKAELENALSLLNAQKQQNDIDLHELQSKYEAEIKRNEESFQSVLNTELRNVDLTNKELNEKQMASFTQNEKRSESTILMLRRELSATNEEIRKYKAELDTQKRRFSESVSIEINKKDDTIRILSDMHGEVLRKLAEKDKLLETKQEELSQVKATMTKLQGSICSIGNADFHINETSTSVASTTSEVRMLEHIIEGCIFSHPLNYAMPLKSLQMLGSVYAHR